MIRTSKFRFWNFIVGRMSQVYTLQQLHEEEVNFNNLRELQFSGVKTDGIEIFEGDVVYIAGYGNYVVEFPFFELHERILSGDSSDIEKVLGNIYENPELINQ